MYIALIYIYTKRHSHQLAGTLSRSVSIKREKERIAINILICALSSDYYPENSKVASLSIKHRMYENSVRDKSTFALPINFFKYKTNTTFVQNG